MDIKEVSDIVSSFIDGAYDVMFEEERDKLEKVEDYLFNLCRYADYYLVSEKELSDLVNADLRLDALECGGVDNWEWYGQSIYDYVESCAQDYPDLQPNEEDEGLELSDIANYTKALYPKFK